MYDWMDWFGTTFILICFRWKNKKVFMVWNAVDVYGAFESYGWRWFVHSCREAGVCKLYASNHKLDGPGGLWKDTELIRC